LVSFKRWIRALADVLMALVVLTDRNALAAECTVIRRVMFVSIPLSIILIKYFRTIGTAWDESGMEMWIGATPQKNVLGQVAMVAAIYFLFEVFRNPRSRRVLVFGAFLLMAGWLLKGSPSSRSNTSMLGFVLGVSLLVGLTVLRSKIVYIQRHPGVVLLGLALLFGALQLIQAAGDVSFLTTAIEASGRDATLTGRTDLWTDLLRIAAERPLLGVGYGAFWIGNTHNLWDVHLWKPTQGHNGYLDVYLELGGVGVALLVCLIIASFRAVMALMVTNVEQGMLHLIWLSIIVCHNLTESSYLRGSVDMWFLFALAIITVAPRTPAPQTAVHAAAPAARGLRFRANRRFVLTQGPAVRARRVRRNQ
jgi:exopolysaccharide production protein ExoQ